MFRMPAFHYLPRPVFALLVLLLGGLVAAGCAEPTPPVASNVPPPPEGAVVQMDPAVAAQQADSIQNVAAIQVMDGLDLHLWASEALLADPIGLTFDPQGRAYVTRTFRQDNSEFDIRGYPQWMIRSIGLQTVEDRRAFLHEEMAPERSAENTWQEDVNGDGSHDWRDLAVERERIYRIEDTSGDGVADLSRIFIEDFDTEVTDVAGTVLPVGDDVYIGVAPDMWRVRDVDGDGYADTKESISHGYAVHIGFSGHGMSGLIRGPDGRIYWSIGDIGFNVVDQDGQRWAFPNQGGIMRSEPDGSGFEVFAHGVRNTHEFVFDKYGNLISVDNDGDHPGESERVVYLIDGSDSGWRSNWQYGKYTDPTNNTYKVWMDEEYFKPRFEGQAAHVLPPIANYHSGPAGMTYNPGTALDGQWQDHFFIAEFTGSPARSRIFAFQLEPDGAGFSFAGEEEVTRGLLATGMDFGPDGHLYVADWMEGWGTKDQGRIWRLSSQRTDNAAAQNETAALLLADFTQETADALAARLQHADMRVRMKAQFELADREDAETLLGAVQQTDHQLARLHGLWGLGQIARGTDLAAAAPMVTFLNDSDAEVRAQTAKVLGDIRYAAAADALLPLLADTTAGRVPFFAAEALGRLGHTPAVQPIIDMLAVNNDEDVYLRQAGAIALARIGEADALVALEDHPSRAVRLAAVVALRRMQHPGVARFLDDADEYIVTDAARAINDDSSIEAAMPELAALLGQTPFDNEPLLRRVINANLRVGGPDAAARLAAFAGTDAPSPLCAEALATLGSWPDPSVVDRVDGVHRGTLERNPTVAQEALGPELDALLATTDATVRLAAVQATGNLAYAPALPALLGLLQQDPDSDVRIAALQALHTAGYDDMEGATRIAQADADREVRMAALEQIPNLNTPVEQKAALLAAAIDDGTTEEQQSALEALGALQNPAAHTVLAGLLDNLEAGSVAPEIQLDVMDAATTGGSAELAERVERFRTTRAGGTPPGLMDVAAYQEVLYGGNARRGARVIYRHPAAQCMRCHMIDDFGGDVGPELTGVGAQYDREYLLAALVAPSDHIAPGFGTLVLTLNDGSVVSGTLREETATHVLIMTASGETLEVLQENIAERQDGPSSMPPMGAILNRRELRDVVEFLTTMQGFNRGTPAGSTESHGE